MALKKYCFKLYCKCDQLFSVVLETMEDKTALVCPNCECAVPKPILTELKTIAGAVNRLQKAQHALKERPLRAVTLAPISEGGPPYPAEEVWLY